MLEDKDTTLNHINQMNGSKEDFETLPLKEEIDKAFYKENFTGLMKLALRNLNKENDSKLDPIKNRLESDLIELKVCRDLYRKKKKKDDQLFSKLLNTISNPDFSEDKDSLLQQCKLSLNSFIENQKIQICKKLSLLSRKREDQDTDCSSQSSEFNPEERRITREKLIKEKQQLEKKNFIPSFSNLFEEEIAQKINFNQHTNNNNKYRNISKENKEKMDNNNLFKYWNWIVKREIPRRQKEYQKYKQDVDFNSKRINLLCQKEVRKKTTKMVKDEKDAKLRAKKLEKEILQNIRKKEKDANELKKKKEREELERIKKQQELEEAVKQKKRLEYLMTQSDIYSFFMSKKLGVEVEAKKEDEIIPTQQVGDDKVEVLYDENNKIIKLKVEVDKVAAEQEVKNIIENQMNSLNKFDSDCNKLRMKAGGSNFNTEIREEKDKRDINALDNPNIKQTISTPSSFKGVLKHYQLKGLNWLDNLFEMGINGILADEMGLGKTIQAISLLSHITENKNNWGPFLVISPNATLYNWQQEINKFCPNLKVLPYWGGKEERKTLRKFFNPLSLYTNNSSFHVCITSYQFIVQDQKVFNRVAWQYMILDEAHSIKNINSIRWNTLLEFSCRGRLLLTGTPIQNNMSELWALLHFIMPTFFNSHEQFQEWFSKDIEAHSQEKAELNEEQLKRLHTILKPFMLRRVKRDVENEIGPKTEYEIICEMSNRQKILYNTIRSKLNNISDLFSSVDSKVKVENLMNLVMQFRKVCNHPELFERSIGKNPLFNKNLLLSTSEAQDSLNFNYNIKDDVISIFSESKNCISFILPKTIYDTNFNKEVSIEIDYFDLCPILRFSCFDEKEFKKISKNNLLTIICVLHYLKKYLTKKNYLVEYLKNENVSLLDCFISREVFSVDERYDMLSRLKKNLRIDGDVFGGFQTSQKIVFF